MHVILMGPPGAGKGTQASRIADETGIEHINVGDMLRQAIRQETELGTKIQSFVEAGELVPDHLVVDLMKDTLQDLNRRNKGVVIDGYPRNLAQAEALEEMLSELDIQIDAVVYLEVEEEELIRRLTGRRVCRDCGATFHIEYDAPHKQGICDECGGKLHQREDDKRETIEQRLKVYHEETEPLIEFYEERGLLMRVDGSQPIDDVSTSLLEVVGELSG